MSVAVRCTNIVRYDPQQGKYVRCGHEFRVKDELVGRSVRCPQCGQSVTVSGEPAPAKSSTAAPQAKAASRPAPATPEPVAAERRRPAASPPPATKRPPAASDVPQSPADLDDDGFRLSEPVELPKLSFPGIDLPSADQPARPAPPHSQTSPPGPAAARPSTSPPAEQASEAKAPCPSCGQPVLARTVMCPSCGYHKGLQRRVDEFEEEAQEHPVGFERWLRRQLVEGDDPNAIRSVLVVAGLLLMALGVVLFLIIGHLVWLLAAAAGVAAAGVWLGWWKLDPWQWLLFANRMIQWRSPMPPFPHRKVLDLRNMAIGDGELGSLQNLTEFEVLDLEGAPVTDGALPLLYDYRNLQFIVLRDTQTTEKGAALLQQALPTAWIWR